MNGYLGHAAHVGTMNNAGYLPYTTSASTSQSYPATQEPYIVALNRAVQSGAPPEYYSDLQALIMAMQSHGDRPPRPTVQQMEPFFTKVSKKSSRSGKVGGVAYCICKWPQCGEKTTTFQRAIDHFFNKHLQKNLFYCDQCTHSSLRKADLDKHKKKSHGVPRPRERFTEQPYQRGAQLEYSPPTKHKRYPSSLDGRSHVSYGSNGSNVSNGTLESPGSTGSPVLSSTEEWVLATPYTPGRPGLPINHPNLDRSTEPSLFMTHSTPAGPGHVQPSRMSYGGSHPNPLPAGVEYLGNDLFLFPPMEGYPTC